jgi:hypothetical protein
VFPCVIAALLAQAPVATTPGAPPAAESTLSGSVALGGVVLTGNSETTTFAFGTSLTKKTPDWIYGFKASAAYGRSTDPSTGVESTSAANGSASLRAARRFGDLLAVYLEGVVDTDHLKSIEWRPAGELGASFQLVDKKEGDFQTQALRVDFGFRGGYEYRFQYYPTPVNLPDQTIAGPKAGFALRYAFSREAVLSDELNALVNIPDGPRLLLTNVIKLATRIESSLTFAVSYGISEDTEPPPGKKNLDTTLTVALEMTF